MELLKADVEFPKLILTQDFRRVYTRDLVFPEKNSLSQRQSQPNSLL